MTLSLRKLNKVTTFLEVWPLYLRGYQNPSSMFRCLILIALVFTACKDRVAELPSAPSNKTVKADTLASGLEQPWGAVFLPNGSILIAEKRGTLQLFQAGRLTPVTGAPQVYTNGQGGLLDLQLHPQYAQNGFIYFTYAKPGNGGGSTTLARATLQGTALQNVQDLFTVQPFISSGVHFGSRIQFDGKGFLYMSTGERGTKENAQDLRTQNGKVLRFHDDGRVPADNPFVGQSGAQPQIWSYGHRNVQGLVYDATTGILWAHEHGARGGDELNIVQRGKNYGWPLVTHGIDYDGSIISPDKERPGIEPPVHTWTPSIAPCGMALVTSNQYPGWKGSLLVGALAGRHIARLTIENGKVKSEERLLENGARVRWLGQGPDGMIYVLTEGPGNLLRLKLN